MANIVGHFIGFLIIVRWYPVEKWEFRSDIDYRGVLFGIRKTVYFLFFLFGGYFWGYLFKESSNIPNNYFERFYTENYIIRLWDFFFVWLFGGLRVLR